MVYLGGCYPHAGHQAVRRKGPPFCRMGSRHRGSTPTATPPPQAAPPRQHHDGSTTTAATPRQHLHGNTTTARPKRDTSRVSHGIQQHRAKSRATAIWREGMGRHPLAFGSKRLLVLLFRHPCFQYLSVLVTWPTLD